MKIKMNIRIMCASALVCASCLSLASCDPTAKEQTIEYNVLPPSEQDPVYAARLADLKAYKKTEHPLVYGRFNNDSEAAANEGGYLRSLPDSLDIAGFYYADKMSDYDRADIPLVQRAGTRILYCVRTAELTAETVADAMSRMKSDFAACGFDGVSVVATKPMGDIEAAVMEAVLSVAGGKTGKLLIFEGNPTFVTAANRGEFAYYVIDTTEKGTFNEVISEITYTVNLGRVPRANIILSSKRSGSLMNGDVKYDGIPGAAAFLAGDGGIAGMAIYDIGQDYYGDARTYDHTRRAIGIANPPANTNE